MTVGMLIKVLQQYPPNLQVTLKGAGYNYGKLSADKVTGASVKSVDGRQIVELSIRRRHDNPGKW